MSNQSTTRTMCMQLSVSAARWPDDMLDGNLTANGRPLTAAEAREALHALKDAGYDVVPCFLHRCEDNGDCTGEPLEAVAP